MKSRYIALVGPPNSGKTTFFNYITGQNSKVVNYPGSTIDISISKSLFNENLFFLDTPGLHSLKAKSDDEKISIKTLENLDSIFNDANQRPDLVISFVDMNQPSRHLLSTIQLIESGYPVVLIVNKFSKNNNLIHYNLDKLQERLNIPIFELNSDKSSIKKIQDFLNQYSFQPYHTTNVRLDSLKSYYARIENVLSDINYEVKEDNSLDLDSIFLHPIFGPLLFLLIMFVFFYSIFTLASPFTNLIDYFFTQLNSFILNTFSENIVTRFITDGMVNAIASVVIFVPQIAFLFFGIGLMESTGYLARGAIIIDKPLSLIGLNGRCFVPILSGFACAIPAMLATRNIQQEKIKLICCFIIPLMQCSARLPVFGLLLTLLFPDSSIKCALGLTIIYFLSLLLSVIVIIFVEKIIKGTTNKQFNLELPRWRVPNFLSIWASMIKQTFAFISNAGPIIFGLSIILWLLSVFPSPENSFIIIIGKFIEPLFLPMGLDWRVGVAILLSFAAREVFVSALVVIFSISSVEINLLNTLKTATFDGTNNLIFTIPSIISLIVFFMIALQCLSTLAIAKKETKSFKFAYIQFFTYTIMAYLFSIILFHILSFFY